MTGDRDRLVAWDWELTEAHSRLRDALRISQDGLASGRPAESAARDLLLYCHGFCVALDAHHRGEDRRLFPHLRARHPQLSSVIDKLEQDHSMIAHLLAALEKAVSTAESPTTLALHLEGIAAIMESHFRYEERELLGVLRRLDWDAEPVDVLGGLQGR